MSFPNTGTFSNEDLVESEMQQALEDMLAACVAKVGGVIQTVEIAAGVLAPSRAYVAARTESSAATDQITNIVPDDSSINLVLLRLGSGTEAITVTHEAGGDGQIHLRNSSDRELKYSYVLPLYREGSDWYERPPNTNPDEALEIGELNVGAADTPSTTVPGTTIGASGLTGYIASFRDVGTETVAAAKFGGTGGQTIIRCDGDVENTNNSYGAISDVRFKENIESAASQWDDVLAVVVRNFNLIGSDLRQIGVVAQELELVSPGCVSEDEDGTKSVAYSVLQMKAFKALQEAMERIVALETSLSSFTARVEALEAS